MQVFIMRHGAAMLNMTSDALRTLTIHGKNETYLIATYLNAKIVDIERVLISPYLRAKETLGVIRTVITLPKEERLSELTPNGNAKYIISHLYSLARQGINYVLIISHLPLIKNLVNYLCPEEYSAIFVTSSLTKIYVSATGYSKWEGQVNP